MRYLSFVATLLALAPGVAMAQTTAAPTGAGPSSAKVAPPQPMPEPVPIGGGPTTEKGPGPQNQPLTGPSGKGGPMSPDSPRGGNQSTTASGTQGRR